IRPRREPSAGSDPKLCSAALRLAEPRLSPPTVCPPRLPPNLPPSWLLGRACNRFGTLLGFARASFGGFRCNQSGLGTIGNDDHVLANDIERANDLAAALRFSPGLLGGGLDARGDRSHFRSDEFGELLHLASAVLGGFSKGTYFVGDD